MTIMNEGLPLNSNYIKFGLKKVGFQDPLSSFPNTATLLLSTSMDKINIRSFCSGKPEFQPSPGVASEVLNLFTTLIIICEVEIHLINRFNVASQTVSRAIT